MSVPCFATNVIDGNPNLFDFKPISVAQVYKALKGIDHKNSAGPDNLDPYLLKVDSDIIAEPHVFCPKQYLKLRKLPFFSLYIKEETCQS